MHTTPTGYAVLRTRYTYDTGYYRLQSTPYRLHTATGQLLQVITECWPAPHTHRRPHSLSLPEICPHKSPDHQPHTTQPCSTSCWVALLCTKPPTHNNESPLSPSSLSLCASVGVVAHQVTRQEHTRNAPTSGEGKRSIQPSEQIFSRVETVLKRICRERVVNFSQGPREH